MFFSEKQSPEGQINGFTLFVGQGYISHQAHSSFQG
jgi:hypothetical protein